MSRIKAHGPKEPEICDCTDCADDPDYACGFDCGECEGCQESRGEREDQIFEIDCATGRR